MRTRCCDSANSESKQTVPAEDGATKLNGTLSKERFATILDSINDGVFTVNDSWQITSFNRAAEQITGIAREKAIGQKCAAVFQADICDSACALRQTMETGKPVINKAVHITNKDGQCVPISISTALLKDENGNVIGGVETFRDLTLVEKLRRELQDQFCIGDIVSRSARMREIADLLPAIAESDATCLIEGESGTGKELIARAIHSLGSKPNAPFVAVNCGALPDTLLESELFGYEPGAFTDAKKSKLGRFALAEGGTIFLDEIGDMSPALQVRLLRVLQEKCYEPLGSTVTKRTNVRVLAATNTDLLSLVRKKKFRQDLYYRINVVRIKLPALRERLEDIPLLIEHFIDRYNKLKGKEIEGVSDAVTSVFMRHDWVGNVRELENAVEHAFILCSGGIVELQHLPEQFRSELETSPLFGSSLADIEAHAIFNTLKNLNWNRQNTATRLGIDKSTLWRKIKEYGLDRFAPKK